MAHGKGKRVLAIVLAIIVVVAAVAVAVAVTDTDPKDQLPMPSQEELAEQILCEAIENHEPGCEGLDDYALSAEAFQTVYADIMTLHPEFFYLDSSALLEISTRGFSEDAMYVTSFSGLSYRYGVDESEAMADELDAALDEAVTFALGDGTGVIGIDVEVTEAAVCRAHDYLVATCDYDSGYLDGAVTSPDSYTMYGALVRHCAVCEGYAAAFSQIMDRIGVPCITVRSEAMNHCWNMVQIDGTWYHIDVTHDDPVWLTTEGEVLSAEDLAAAGKGEISHERYLKSDATMQTLGYYGWTTDLVAPSDWQ